MCPTPMPNILLGRPNHALQIIWAANVSDAHALQIIGAAQAAPATTLPTPMLDFMKAF